jgi:hypothetical protein
MLSSVSVLYTVPSNRYVTVVLVDDYCIMLTLTVTAHSCIDPLTDWLIGGFI